MSLMSFSVRGDVKPESLGFTLPHEHLGMEFNHFYRKPPQSIAEYLNRDIDIRNVGYLRQYPYSCKYNLCFNDNETFQSITSDVHMFKKLGGGTIVENSTEGLDRNVSRYKYCSEKTGVNVVAGTGYYISDTLPCNLQFSSTEEMYKHMRNELTIGCSEDDTVKAGFIGEIASVWPLRDSERKAIQATGELQEEIGCGVSFHPHRDPEAPFEIIRLYLEAGGKVNKAVMSHLDRTLLEDQKLLEFAELGTYCQFDLFGVEVSYYQLNASIDMPSDAQRLDKIKLLVDEKKEEKILMSHDIHTKHRLTKFGGHGYHHILLNVIPRMKTRGFSLDVIDTITIRNPAQWLAMPTMQD
ncbi:phosphotriesterase-related protein [Achroia grisella]|uniref:phosphotriesterase-related protein n=1 Tax=Achroia grisella TaxID=688607 RepID=UPI0027D2B60E|nr:phosphotriesterase-related protein [Achroia grisella]